MPDPDIDFLDDEEIVPSDQQESEDDLHPEKERVGEAVLFNTDWTVETLFRQIQKRNINLDPKFQRREAWDVFRKSKFIESILCNLPIPNVVLAEENKAKGRYLVIDGKQRLFSISSFLQDEFELKGLTILPELNGANFSTLVMSHSEVVNSLENYPIRTVIIRNWPDEDYLYTVFYRLNSGSLQLSPQELRKALHGGILLDHIDEYIKGSEPFKTVFGQKLDPRMRDIELVLRFISFERFFDDYRGDLKNFLDRTVKIYDGAWPLEKPILDQDLRKMDLALTIAHKIFGKDSFKKWNGQNFERRINRAVFDAIARYFGDEAITDAVLQKQEDIVRRFKNLCAESEIFRGAIERTTKTLGATQARYVLWGEQLADAIERKLDRGSMRII
jgi:hypothetical protein